MGTFCPSGQRKGSKIFVCASPAMPACVPGAALSALCLEGPSVCRVSGPPASSPPSLLLFLHLLTSDPSVKCPVLVLPTCSVVVRIRRAGAGRWGKEVSKQPVAPQTQGRQTSLSPSWPVPAALGCRTRRRHRCQSRGSSLAFPGGASVSPSVFQLP